MRGLTATAQRSVWSLPALAGIPRYGYLGLIFGFGVTALLLIFLHVAAWVTNTTDQKTRVSRRHRIDSSASVARQRHHHRR